MSYQIVCDNCQFFYIYPDGRMPHYSAPANWENIYGSEKEFGYQRHLCPECVKAKDAVRWDMQAKLTKAQEEALAARRVKV